MGMQGSYQSIALQSRVQYGVFDANAGTIQTINPADPIRTFTLATDTFPSVAIAYTHGVQRFTGGVYGVGSNQFW